MAVIRTEKIYVGMLAVNPKRTNYTGITEQGQASLMTTLKDQNRIPSLSFGYTAGAPYRLKKVLGSLTLGGYDQSRFTPNDMTFSFAPDTDRDLVVGIQSITSNDQDGTSRDLLATGINAYVDSTIAQIWLPLEACKLFEKAFGLTYDQENQMYPVSDRLHKKLRAQNASITFTLGNSDSGGQSIDITLPYDSFDLQAKPPFAPNATRYFPLQRAANETQYTLGRTFLQEAYLAVDWERQSFAISQCSFDSDMTQQSLVSIQPVNSTTAAADEQGATSKGMIIGVAVGVAAAAILVIGGIATFFVVRKRKQKHQGAEHMAKETDDEAEMIRQGFAKAELDTDPNHAVYEMGHPGLDLHAGTRPDRGVKYPRSHAELMGGRLMAEMNGSGQLASELPAYKGFAGPCQEMYDPSVPPVELPATVPKELPASPPPAISRSSKSSSAVFRSAIMSPRARSDGPLDMHQPSRSNVASQYSSPRATSSRVQSPESWSSTPLSSAKISKGPSSPDFSGTCSPQEQARSGPVSPVEHIHGGTSTDHRGLFSFVRGLNAATHSSKRASRGQQ
ncbi:MAG: hypothetical protein Q9169_000808 [Polycauliona sp. 2 TL-2023]